MNRTLGVMAWSFACTVVAAQKVHVSLNEGWNFRQVGKEVWHSAVVPGVVQSDLLRHGLIPDPYMGSNVDSVQWIENEDWEYRRTLDVSDTVLRHGQLDLVFKGLDTFTEVYINGSLLGRTDNMFRTWIWSIKPLLHIGENELTVIFRSPIKEGARLRTSYGIQLPHDSDPSGVSPYIRKAAYQFGWDFCPRLVTCGIWQGVELQGWSQAAITSFRVETIDRGDRHEVRILPGFDVQKKHKHRLKVLIDGELRIDEVFSKASGHQRFEFSTDIRNGNVWWPNGHGDQPLYEVRAELWSMDSVLLDSRTALIGLREIRLLQRKDSVGRSFGFEVNGKPIFAKGCNLVPPHLMLPSVGDSAWVALVRHMQLAGMNMVRVWSGGVYPPDAFLHACDTAGIMIWQDLMFGSLVPGDKQFERTAAMEVAQQVLRIGNHAALALWCGNNELDVAWKYWGWQQTYRYSRSQQRKIARTNKAFFHERLEQLTAHHGGVNYTPSSPLSNWGSAKGLRSGDLHYWGVWHGDSTFNSFANNVGRFVSEWGFQSYPDSALLSQYIDPKDLVLGSSSTQRLQRSYKTDRPIWEAIERELGERPTTLGEFIEASQQVQAKAYRLATQAHMNARPTCMGTLLWQLNDCWPGPSWSIIDVKGNQKPAYYVVQEVFTTP